MTDPTRPPVADPKGRTPDELQDRIHELLRRIEDTNAVSPWCWPQITDTLGYLAALGDDIAWIQAAYLSCVLVRGDAMFSRTANQPELVQDGGAVPTIPCRCGERVPVETPRRVRQVDVMCVRCPACGIDLATFDGELYDRPTLIARGLAG